MGIWPYRSRTGARPCTSIEAIKEQRHSAVLTSRTSGGPYCEAFFPDGPDSVVVITVTASQAEYWDNDKGSLSIAFEVTKAYFGDHGPDLGENAKLDL